MEICSAPDFCRGDPCVTVLGFFDGVHLGHRALLRFAAEAAAARSLPLTVFTFPAEESGLKQDAPRIYSTGEKLALLEECGADRTVLCPFPSVAGMAAEDFVRRVLIGQIGSVCTVSGEDFRFGASASGDVALLCALMASAGGEHFARPTVYADGAPVSSSRIRALLCTGELSRAAALLGAPYFQLGTVSHGDGRGRSRSVPTLNLTAGITPLLPFGVYATRTVIGGSAYPSVTDVGTTPTVSPRPPHSETHVFGLSRDVYGESARVEYLSFLRPERKFSDEAALYAQITQDKIKAMEAFETWQISGQN